MAFSNKVNRLFLFDKTFKPSSVVPPLLATFCIESLNLKFSLFMLSRTPLSKSFIADSDCLSVNPFFFNDFVKTI